MLTIEQIVTHNKDQAAALYELVNQAVNSLERLTDLNLKTIKAAVTESAAKTEALLAVKDVQALVSLQNQDLKATAEKVSAYGRELYEIATVFGGEVNKLAEASAAEVQKQFATLLDTVVKNAPKGTEQAAAALQSAVSTAGTALESVQKAVKQATQQATANLDSLTKNTLNVVDVKAKKVA